MADASPKTNDRLPISLTDRRILAACDRAIPARDLSPIVITFVPSRFCLSSVNCVRIFLIIDELAAPQRPRSDVAAMNKCFLGPSTFSTSRLS